ncbi:MAG: ATP-binding cassette domain-containing protein, partial [Deltaproteobacteria bacterium]|nr:ATP-binding cassette domain-containing protein [Deltaproteobacteria bacterium]
MIQIEKVTKSFNERKVLDNVSLSIEKGECVFILGKSGVGKSVLLKAIVGLIEIDCGSITVGGLKVDPTSQETLSQVRKGCGLVFQFSALLDSVNVFE